MNLYAFWSDLYHESLVRWFSVFVDETMLMRGVAEFEGIPNIPGA